MRVLLVDDEEFSLTELRYSIDWERYGFTEIVTTTDPQQALDFLINLNFDAAFLDIRMPGITGLELLAKAREHQVRTCFVIVSGYSDFSYARESMRLNALDYCLKPLDPDEVTPVMEKLTQKIYQQHLLSDPKYTTSLISDASLCDAYLSDIFHSRPLPDSLTLLLIRSSDFRELIRHTASVLPTPHVLFPGSEKVFLFWETHISEDRLQIFFSSCQFSDLMIAMYSSCSVSGFQAALKRLQKEYDNRVSRKEDGFFILSSANKEMSQYFADILHYVDTHYSEKISLQELSDKFSINYTYLSQLFKKISGKSFSDYLTEIRLVHACRLLTDTETNITLISECVGFHDYRYFCSSFKNAYGMSPRQYRAATRSQP